MIRLESNVSNEILNDVRNHMSADISCSAKFPVRLSVINAFRINEWNGAWLPAGRIIRESILRFPLEFHRLNWHDDGETGTDSP